MYEVFYSLPELKAQSLQVYPGMVLVWQDNQREEKLSERKFKLAIIGYNKTFHCLGGVIAFISGGEMYVTPYTEYIYQSLKAAGFERSDFYMPINAKCFPKEEMGEWQEMLERAKMSYSY